MFEEILESCKYVIENSKNVKIRYDKINEILEKIENSNYIHWLNTSPFGIMELETKDIINFLLIYDSINCSFWGEPKWTINADGNQLDGGIALMYALLQVFKDNKDINIFTYLENLSKEEFKNILNGNVEIPLFEERYNIVTNISKTVNEKMNGNFYEYIKDVTNDRELFYIIISNFSSFEDKRTYLGKDIYFYKLAQLLTSDILHVRELKEKLKVDYSNIVGCADYKIPQVLRGLGITEYSDELSYIVDNSNLIPENSNYELEIRASMIVVIDIIKNKLDCKFSAIDINDYIWLQGRDKSKELKPYHLTRTTKY